MILLEALGIGLRVIVSYTEIHGAKRDTQRFLRYS